MNKYQATLYKDHKAKGYVVVVKNKGYTQGNDFADAVAMAIDMIQLLDEIEEFELEVKIDPRGNDYLTKMLDEEE